MAFWKHFSEDMIDERIISDFVFFFLSSGKKFLIWYFVSAPKY